MNTSLKIGLVLLIVASVLFLCSTVAFYILREAEKEKIVYLKQELKSVEDARESIAKDLEEIKVVKRNLESKLNSAEEEARRISEELIREKEAKKIIMSQFEEEKKKSDSLMTDIMNEKEKHLNLLQQLSKAEEAYRGLREQFELMVEAKETLEKKFKAMMAKKGVELERIEVRRGYQKDERSADTKFNKPSPMPRSSKNGNVLVVNKKFDFIVANMGKLDGVDVGTELDVYRDTEFIAKTKVEKLYDKMSAATILPGWENATIKEGDQVYVSQ